MGKISKRTAKKMDMRKVVEVVETGDCMSVTLQMISSDYKLKWYKTRLRLYAINLGLKVNFSDEEQRATIYFNGFGDAYLFKTLFVNKE